MPALHDMHCHLDFMTNAAEVAADARASGTLLFANTVTPDGWQKARTAFAGFDNVVVGFGMHPWWVAGAREDAPDVDGEDAGDAPTGESPDAGGASQRQRMRRIAERAAESGRVDDPQAARQREEALALLDKHDPRVIGEIGLDFGWRHQGNRSEQLATFEALAGWAARRGGKLLSVHAIKAAGEALDTLERTGALASCDCIFHWFSGTSEQLKRAVRAGCYFSCGPRMLATGKGREYVKAIPAAQLLLETDAPPEQDMPYSHAALREELESAARSIATIKGEGSLEALALTSERLLTARTGA